MEMTSDILIASVYGRGHWLAADLASKGFKVTLADITGVLGRWTPSDWEGPFGFFRTDKLESLQSSRLLEEAPSESVETGFSIWWDKGLLELKGPLYKYQYSQSGLSEQTEDYLTHKINVKEVNHQEFYRNWLACLAHQVAANVFVPSAEAISYGKPLPVFEEYAVRQLTREGFERSLTWCKRLNVNVIRNAKIDDLYFDGKNFGGAEISCETPGLFRSQKMIWCLSSEESQRTPDSVHSRLFPRGFVSPVWTWMRYRVVLDSQYFNEILPTRFLLIDSIFLPWTHANSAFVQKTAKEGHYDIWLRLPSTQRFQGPYLKSMGDELVTLLEKKLPGVKASLQDMPQDYYYDYSELGASPHPVFDLAGLGRLKTANINNLFFDGPEYWQTLDVGGQLRYQQDIRNEIVSARMKELRERQ